MLFFYQHSFNVKVFCGKCICSERIDQQIQQIGTVYFSIGMFHFVFSLYWEMLGEQKLAYGWVDWCLKQLAAEGEGRGKKGKNVPLLRSTSIHKYIWWERQSLVSYRDYPWCIWRRINHGQRKYSYVSEKTNHYHTTSIHSNSYREMSYSIFKEDWDAKIQFAPIG